MRWRFERRKRSDAKAVDGAASTSDRRWTGPKPPMNNPIAIAGSRKVNEDQTPNQCAQDVSRLLSPPQHCISNFLARPLQMLAIITFFAPASVLFRVPDQLLALGIAVACHFRRGCRGGCSGRRRQDFSKAPKFRDNSYVDPQYAKFASSSTRCGRIFIDAAEDDGSADVVAEYEAAAATPGAPNPMSWYAGKSAALFPTNAMAWWPRLRIAPAFATPIGQNNQRSPRSVPATIPSAPNMPRRVPSERCILLSRS